MADRNVSGFLRREKPGGELGPLVIVADTSDGGGDPTAGNVNVTNFPASDPLSAYRIADVDSAGAVKYYGFQAVDGAWYILREDTSVSPNTYRYAVGASGYPANWTGRAALTYGYLADVL